MPPFERYPWRCLWRGLVQITRTTPFRLMILHFSHRTLTDGFTFISRSQPSAISHQLGLASQAESGSLTAAGSLFEPVRDAPARQVVGGELHLDPVAGEDPNKIHAHLPRDVRQHSVPIVELDSKHGVRERFHHGAFDLDRIFLRHRLRLMLPASRFTIPQ